MPILEFLQITAIIFQAYNLLLYLSPLQNGHGGDGNYKKTCPEQEMKGTGIADQRGLYC